MDEAPLVRMRKAGGLCMRGILAISRTTSIAPLTTALTVVVLAW